MRKNGKNEITSCWSTVGEIFYVKKDKRSQVIRIVDIESNDYYSSASN